MTTMIDTDGLARDLEQAGVAREQAQAMARAIRDHSTLVSRADLNQLDLRHEARLTKFDQGLERRLEAIVERRLEVRLGAFQAGMLKWVTVILIAQAAVIVALLRLLPAP